MHSTGAARLSRASRACIRSSSHLGFPRPCPRPLSKFQPCRTYTQTPGLQAAVQSEQTRQRPVIQSALPSIEATLARLLPASLSEAELPFSRALCGSILGKVVEQVRAAADAPSVEDAKASWQRIDEEIRSGEEGTWICVSLKNTDSDGENSVFLWPSATHRNATAATSRICTHQPCDSSHHSE